VAARFKRSRFGLAESLTDTGAPHIRFAAPAFLRVGAEGQAAAEAMTMRRRGEDHVGAEAGVARARITWARRPGSRGRGGADHVGAEARITRLFCVVSDAVIWVFRGPLAARAGRVSRHCPGDPASAAPEIDTPGGARRQCAPLLGEAFLAPKVPVPPALQDGRWKGSSAG
jgi:hypothetical protein